MLRGKTAIVTGSSSGIGLGVAESFAKAGINVMMNGIEPVEQIADHVGRLEGYGVKVAYSPANMMNPDEVRNIVALAEAKFGQVDILVNNAGIQFVAPVDEFPDEKWDAIIAINLSAAFHAIKMALPGMKTRGWGRIINISSAAAVKPAPGMGVYSSIKAAVNTLTVTLARGVSGDNVTINTVSPGVIYTSGTGDTFIEYGMAADLAEAKAALNKMVAPDTPFARAGEVEEVANVVVFLASPLAAYIHGANIRVDGGYVPTLN